MSGVPEAFDPSGQRPVSLGVLDRMIDEGSCTKDDTMVIVLAWECLGKSGVEQCHGLGGQTICAHVISTCGDEVAYLRPFRLSMPKLQSTPGNAWQDPWPRSAYNHHVSVFDQ